MVLPVTRERERSKLIARLDGPLEKGYSVGCVDLASSHLPVKQQGSPSFQKGAARTLLHKGDNNPFSAALHTHAADINQREGIVLSPRNGTKK